MTVRDRMIVIVIASVAVIVGAWMFAVSPRRDQASKLGAQVASAQAQLSSVQATLAQRQAVKQTFSQSYSELTRLGEAVPADDDVPSLLYQIQSVAKAAKVDFQSINVTPSTAAPAPPAPAPASSGTSTTPTSSTPPASAPASSAASAPSAGASSAGTFSSDNFSFVFQGNFFHLADFFARLQGFVQADGNALSVSGRLLTLNSISLQEGPAGFPQIEANVTATAYVVPAAQGLLNGATAAGPAAPAVTTTPASTPAAVPTPTAAVVR